MQMKENIARLVESPLNLNLDLLENDLFSKESPCMILQLMKKQHGVTQIMKSAHDN